MKKLKGSWRLLMNCNKKEYDLICSLGGNCAAAHNLLYKGLRTCAYPFDWTYFNSDEAVYKLAEGFKDNFKNYALKENFKELPVNSEHPERIQYEDTYAKIIWANHFDFCENPDANYKEVKEKLDRRFQRLISSVQAAQKIFFLFSTCFQIKPDAFLNLINTLKQIYPNKTFKIKVLSFSADIYEDGNVEICYYKRKMNNQDFVETSKEWDFLDNINEFERFLCHIKAKVLKLVINFVPFRFMRKKLREKYNVQ